MGVRFGMEEWIAVVYGLADASATLAYLFGPQHILVRMSYLGTWNLVCEITTL